MRIACEKESPQCIYDFTKKTCYPDFSIYRVKDLDKCVFDDYFGDVKIAPATGAENDLPICRMAHLCELEGFVEEFQK